MTWTVAVATFASLALWGVQRLHRQPGSWVEILFTLVNLPVSTSLVSFVVLWLMTRALIGRKRLGLVAVAVCQLFGIALAVDVAVVLSTPDSMDKLDGWWMMIHPSTVIDVLAVVPAVFILWLCWWVRPAFPGRLRPGAWATAGIALVTGFAFAAALAWTLLGLAHRAVPSGSQVTSVLLNGLGVITPHNTPVHQRADLWISQLVSIIVAGTIVLAVALFLRFANDPHGWTGAREVALRGLLARHGARDSLGYFATRRDKSSIFAPDGQAAVCYELVAGVSLAAGDPVGDPASWPAAIEAWKSEARRYGWIPAVLGASEEAARAYTAAGMVAMNLGDEAILRPDTYRINNTSMTTIRRAVQHARRAGLHVQIRRQEDIEADELAHLIRLADEWREGEERGFSMALERRGDPADGATLYVSAHDEVGECVGLLSFVPWGNSGASLDTMRRSPGAPNGTVELLVSELMARADEVGILQISLNFVVLRGVFEDADRLGAGLLTKLNSSLLGGLDRFFQLERLYRANRKFEPTWVPRYLCFDSRLSIPQAMFACALAEGFVPRPLRRARGGTLTDDELADVRSLPRDRAVDLDSLAPSRSEQTRVRLAHLAELQATGRDPYAVGVPGALNVSDLDSRCWQEGAPIRLAGRVRGMRDHGGVVFIRLVGGGREVQLLCEREVLGEPELRQLARCVDIGDMLLVQASPGRSRNGTPSLLVHSWSVSAKSLHPIPFERFTDPESRLRARVTDLIVHPEQADLLRQRAAIVHSVRASLHEAGFLEVDTPMLQSVHGGASARPFSTFSNAYGVELSLRIAPELHLKRLLVAGMGPIYELGRNFRNEGADATHNPEFTSLEVYQPYGDYNSMRLLTESLIKAAATAVHGSPMLPLHAKGEAPGALVDVSAPWPVVPFLEALSQVLGTPVSLETDMEKLIGLAKKHQVAIRPDMGPGAILEELYADLVEARTINPTFYTDFPVETSPLTGAHRSHPGLVERWDLVACGMELGTAYSELTDPIEQRRRLTEQSLKAAAGDPEAMEVDEDFLRALETGLPPTGGMGLGIDRLAMLIAGQNIRSVLSFPFVRPLH